MEKEPSQTTENSNSDEFELLTITSSSHEANFELKSGQLEAELAKTKEEFSCANNILSEKVKELTEKLAVQSSSQEASIILSNELVNIREELACCKQEKEDAIKNLGLSQKEIEILKDDIKSKTDKMQKLKNAIVRKTKEALDVRQENTEINLSVSSLTGSVEKLKTELEESKIELASNLSNQTKLVETANTEKAEAVRFWQHYQRLYESTSDELKYQQTVSESIKSEFDDYKVRSKIILEQQLASIVDDRRVAEENEKIKHLESEISNLKDVLESTKIDLQNSKNSCSALCQRFKIIDRQIVALLPLINTSDISNQLTVLNRKIDYNLLKYKRHHDTILSEKRLAHSKHLVEISDFRSKIISFEQENRNLLTQLQQFSDIRERTVSLSTEIQSPNEITPTSSDVLQGIVSEFHAGEPKSTMSQYKNEVENLQIMLAESKRDELLMSNQLSLLKEEVRRMGRTIEGNHHISNMEYLKNIIFKFITLPHGDQKITLVSVIQSILNFTEDEMKIVESVASGHSVENIEGWGSYLYSFVDSGFKYIKPGSFKT